MPTVMNRTVERMLREMHRIGELSDCCGVILAAAGREAASKFDAWKRVLDDERPGIAMEWFYVNEEEGSYVMVLLPGQNLGTTHFVSLLVKDLLEESGVLAGTVMVAGFPKEDLEREETVLRRLGEIAEAAANRRRAVSVQRDHSEEGKVLLVESDEVATGFLTERLQWKGYDVLVASDAPDAIRLYEEHHPTLVITELTLPESDGFSLIRAIRGCGDTDCRIIVLTERRLDRDVRHAFALGASDFVTKPFSPVELEARIRRLTVSA